jgi:hypothetical protein
MLPQLDLAPEFFVGYSGAFINPLIGGVQNSAQLAGMNKQHSL